MYVHRLMSPQVLRLNAQGAVVESLTEATFAPVSHEGNDAGIRAALEAALESPVNYPPLAQVVMPDDFVAIALGEAVAESASIVTGMIASLVGCGLQQERIAVVTADVRDAEKLRKKLSEEMAAGVTIESHDPCDGERLCFLGLTRAEEQLSLNRRLYEADLVLPIMAERPSEAGPDSPYDGVFPGFCNKEAIDRFRRVCSVGSAKTKGSALSVTRRDELDEAGRMIGAVFMVRVVSATAGGTPQVVAGEAIAVAKQAAELSRHAWAVPEVEAAPLVIAILRGGEEDQTWANVGRALELADRFVAPGGVVALWTELDEPIGESLGRLLDADDRDQVASQVSEDSGSEAWAAWQILQSLDRGPLFFHSRLPEGKIEDLGLAPITSAAELLRLADRQGTCLLLDDAQHVRLAIDID